MDSLQGKILIASARLVDPNFARAVVLMVQHNEEGALGLVLNRPLETTVREACEEVLNDAPCLVEGVLHQGGPCEGPLMVVHTLKPSAEIQIQPGLYFTTERSRIERVLKHSGEDEEVSSKFFVGYAGWGAGQLEAEMETGSWLTFPADSDSVFTGGEKQWTQLFTTVTVGRWIDPRHIPDDPSVN